MSPTSASNWEGEGDLYRAIVRDGDDLALEILGQGVVPLLYAGGERWKFRPNPSVELVFDRAESGAVTGYHVGDHQEFRFEPSGELPSAAEIAARVRAAHRIDLLVSLGPLRMSGELFMETLDIRGSTSKLLAWPGFYRIDIGAGENFERLTFDGQRVQTESSASGPETLEGVQAELLKLDRDFVRFGDWERAFPSLQVIQQLTSSEGDSVVLVRAGDTSAPATTYYVHAESGRVVREDCLTYVDMLGRIGRRADYGDFRDVSGMTLPFRIEFEYPTPMLGKIVSTVSDFELGGELPERAFTLVE